MTKGESKLRLTDLIDIKFLQKFQDAFAVALDMASMSVDDEGAITTPSNFTEFCGKYVRASKEGQNRCNKCDIELGKKASKIGEPVIHKCHTGLIDIAVPIIVDGQHIASILIGQVLTEPIDEDKFRKYAKELDVDEDEYVNAAKKIKIMSKEKIKAAAELIFLVANSISSIAHINLQLKTKNANDAFFRKITEEIRSTLDIDEIKKRVVVLIGKTFSADRCYIAEYDSDNEKFLVVKDEYLSSDDVAPYSGVDTSKKNPHFAEILKNGKPIIVINKKIQNENLYENLDEEKKTIEEFNINSAAAFPLFHGKELLGVLTIHYFVESNYITEEVIEIINMVANQIALALYQARLFKATLVNAQREKLIANIMTKTIGAFDISRVNEILKDIGVMTKADRCFFVELDVDEQKGIPVSADAEYLASDDIKTIVGYSFPKEDVEIFIKKWLEIRDLIVFDYEQIRKDNDPNLLGMVNYSAQFDLKTGIGIPFFSEGNLSAILAIEHVNENVSPSKDELEFLKILGNQAGLVFKQIQLYQKTKSTAEREMLLRRIIENMRSTLELKNIKTEIVTEIGKAMKTDVCFILTYDPDTDYFDVDADSEYKPDPSENSRINIDTTDEKVKWFMDTFRNNEELNFSDFMEFIRTNNLQGTPLENFVKEYSIKSGYHIPIYYANNHLGYIILNYTKDYRKLSEDDISFLRIIATQAGIAFHQSRLYKKMQEQAEREKISRSIVEILRSTIDKKIIKHLFVINIGKYFHADRVLFSEYDSKTKMYLPVDMGSEYLSGPEVKSFIGYDWSTKEAREYIQPLLEKRELNIYCWDEYLKNNPNKSPEFISLFEEASVRSSYNLPVLYQDRIMGFFSIEFTKNRCNKFFDEDITRIRNMCTQTGIALYHAELYEQANELLRSKGDYIKKMSCECKVPLERIIELSDLTISETELEKQREAVNEIKRIGNAILEKIERINQNN